MTNGDNAFGTLAEPNQTILVQGLNVASLKCETDTPIAIGGTVRSAQLQAPIVDILESGVVSGELAADEVVIRGTAENVIIRAKRFFATGTAKIQNCTLYLDGVSGCSIDKGAQLTGDFKITTASFAAAATPAPTTSAPAAFVAAPVVPPSFASAVSSASAKLVKAEVKSSSTPAAGASTASTKSSTADAGKSSTAGGGSAWGSVDQAIRSSADTEDGHASLVGTSDTQS